MPICYIAVIGASVRLSLDKRHIVRCLGCGHIVQNLGRFLVGIVLPALRAMPMSDIALFGASRLDSFDKIQVVFADRQSLILPFAANVAYTMACAAGRATRLTVRDPRTPIVLAGRGDNGGVKCYLILACEIGKTLAAIGAIPILDIAVLNASRIDCIDALHCGMPALVVGHARRKRKQAHRRDQHDRNHYGKTLLHQFTFGL